MTNSRIPNQFLFVYGLRCQDEPFHISHYFCIESCFQINHPDRILFFYEHEPWGPWWELVKPRLTLMRISTNPRSYGIRYGWRNRDCRRYQYAHVADFIRLEKLLEFGGVYADIDTIFVHPVPPELWTKPFVLGREKDVVCRTTGRPLQSLCNAFIMSPPNAEFGRCWLEAMPKAFDGSWSNHSTILPQNLSQKMPHSIHIEPSRTFYPYMWSKCDLYTLLEGCQQDTTGISSIHLWSHLWWESNRQDFSVFHHGLMTESHVRHVDTTYNLLARPFLPKKSIQNM